MTPFNRDLDRRPESRPVAGPAPALAPERADEPHRAAPPGAARRAPRLLSGIGFFGVLMIVWELLVRAWPALAGPLLAPVLLAGMVWLSVLVLRTRDAVAIGCVSPLDRLLVHWSGPAAVLVLGLASAFAGAFLAENHEANYFPSRFAQAGFELLMAGGFVLSFCCLVAPRAAHVAPLWLWKVLCAPLLIVYGMYAIFAPLACSAARLPPA